MTEFKPWDQRVADDAPFRELAIHNAKNAEIAELRAALAKSQPVEQVEPVAWRGWDDDKWVFTLWRDEMPVQLEWQPLFTKAQPAREPLTEKPVAWAMKRADGLVFDVICPDEHESYEGEYTMPL